MESDSHVAVACMELRRCHSIVIWLLEVLKEERPKAIQITCISRPWNLQEGCD